MHTTTLPVYDIVLLPPPAACKAAVEVSRQVEHKGTEFTLKEGVVYPHLSLYMANFRPHDVTLTQTLLSDIAAKTKPLPLRAMRYGHNLEQGMFEVFYKKTTEVTALQKAIIATLNPLRQGLRLYDPVGRNLAEYAAQSAGEIRQNIERYGYDEVGSFFKPHITFSRFVQRDIQIPLGELPPLDVFSGIYTELGLFEMGKHGTCLKQIGLWRLA